MKKLIFSFLILISHQYTFAENSEEDIDPKELVKVGINTPTIDGKKYLAVHYTNKYKWHTYWKNPGDAGLSVLANWKSGDKKLDFKPHNWPVPKKYIEKGNIIAYGYGGGYTLFFDFPKTIPNGEITFESKWLVCKHICIPGEISFKGKLLDQGFKTSDPLGPIPSPNEIKTRFMALPKESPKPQGLTFKLAKGSEENTLVLVTHAPVSSQNMSPNKENLVYPYPADLVTFTHEKLAYDGKQYSAKMVVEWDGEYEDPVIPLPKNGKFNKPLKLKFLAKNPATSVYTIVSQTFTEFSTEAVAVPPSKISSKERSDPASPVNNENRKESKSIFFFLAFAFIGGLILNAMPCVLPVIMFKLFGLIQNQNKTRAEILKHNLFYTFGVLFTFALLSMVVILLKNAGESVGWGFQLQSPLFVGSMVVFLLVFALNLFGLFEFGTPGGKSLGQVQLKEGPMSDFLGGVFATILSTPCSAPFLGTALTFAFTSTSAVLFTTFMAIGLGLAFPFILTGLFPKLIHWLPKPGNWMIHLKKFLGLTLIITMLWLLDIYNSLGAEGQVLPFQIALACLFFGIYAYQKIFSGPYLKLLSLLIPILLVAKLLFFPLTDSIAEFGWVPWSEEKMKEYAEQRETVFIDFTAKWCVTCKVNEKLVLSTDDFKKLVEKKGLKLLLGDWTKRDPLIGGWLKRHGKVGVPAYFIQKPDGSLVSLGETLTINEINSHL